MKYSPRHILTIFLASLYFTFLVGCLIILAFPGATFFYQKVPVEISALSIRGNSFLYSFPFNPYLLNPESILVLEDGKVLIKSFTDDPRYEQEGTFNVQKIEGSRITVSFIPTGYAFPENAEDSYEILIRSKILSGNNVGQFAVFLLAGMVIFLGFELIKNQYNLENIHLPVRMANFWKNREPQPVNNVADRSSPRKKLITRSAVNLILLTFIFVLMEWLFFITKPSFMDIFGFPEKVKILLVTFLIAALGSMIVLLFFMILDAAVSLFFPYIRKYLYQIPFSFLAACLCLNLVDNFLYTIFNFGIAGSSSLVRIDYAFGFMILFVFILFKMAARNSQQTNSGKSHFWGVSALIIFVGSLILAVIQINWVDSFHVSSKFAGGLINRPNIILISSDGLDADNMSLYEYGRDTTPFLRELGGTSLVSENNFPNTGHSLGSETSLLTGRHPLATKVLYSPDILLGEDKYKHLPGILKDAGYKTVSLGVPYYSDVNVVNFQDAFDEVNCEERENFILSSHFLTSNFDREVYTLTQIQKRVIERLFHIFFIDDMKSAITTVNEASSNAVSDQERWSCLRSYLDTANRTGQPLFAHIHRMGTHGPMFETTIQRYSKGEEQDDNWMTDFYDDAIINFDSEIANLVEYLNYLNLYENTIIVIYTDHGSDWSTTKRIPLIIHFPNDEYSGIINNNSQNLDIAPTILDYLKIEIPEWMDGASLLNDLNPARIIFSVEPVEPVEFSGLWSIPKNIADLPFLQFGSITSIQCQKITSINLETFVISEGEIANHTSPCSPELFYSRQKILDQISDLFIQTGFQLPEDWK
jgi:arylsulfatase A-like enzyme